MRQKIERVLIHPYDNMDSDVVSVWRAWENLLNTRTIAPHDFNGLEDTTYVGAKDATTGIHLVLTDLTIGGQTGPVCVKSHLEALAQHPRVINGDVRICVDLNAVEESKETMQRILYDIQKNYGVKIQLTNSSR